MSFTSRLMSWLMHLPPAHTHDLVITRDIPIPMPDGVVLLADHYAPRNSSKLPTLLVRSPYGRRGLYSALNALPYAERGYQVLMQSCRGTAGSGGQFLYARHEHVWLLPDGVAGSATTTAVSCASLLTHGVRGAHGAVRRHSVGYILPPQHDQNGISQQYERHMYVIRNNGDTRHESLGLHTDQARLLLWSVHSLLQCAIDFQPRGPNRQVRCEPVRMLDSRPARSDQRNFVGSGPNVSFPGL